MESQEGDDDVQLAQQGRVGNISRKRFGGAVAGGAGGGRGCFSCFSCLAIRPVTAEVNEKRIGIRFPSQSLSGLANQSLRHLELLLQGSWELSGNFNALDHPQHSTHIRSVIGISL
ncbi:hypothetical protein Mapa_015371 [Marchantia paleacea]|nr:hypothetical protein Mapa_015371 [Marchantia paleacea]